MRSMRRAGVGEKEIEDRSTFLVRSLSLALTPHASCTTSPVLVPDLGLVILDSPSPAVPCLSLARVHRLLRPLRSSVAAFSQSLARTSIVPTCTTTTATTATVTTFYRASKSSIDHQDSLEWNNNKPKPKKRPSRGGQLREPVDVVHSSSPFKDQFRRSRARNSRKTYGTKRPTVLVVDPSSSYPSQASTSTYATTVNPGPAASRGFPKSILRTKLETCFSHFSGTSASTELSNLVNRTLHLFQTYDNILQVVYPPPQPGGGPGRSGTVQSLLETCAREIGLQIEDTVDEWLEQVREEEEGRGEDSPDRGWKSQEVDRCMGRTRTASRKSFADRDDSSDDDEPASRRTSTSSYAASLRRTGGGSQEEMTRNEQELECTRMQDEHYEACPPHTYRWILAEHATAIVSNELTKLFESEIGPDGHETVPYELVELWYDWCLSYGAATEASRFHPLLISTALRPTVLASSSSSRPSKPSPIFMPLLLKSPSPIALVSYLDTHLSQSTFQDKLFFHRYLSFPSSLVPFVDLADLTRIDEYLNMMIRLATSMVNSYLEAYRSDLDAEEVRVEGVEKETRDIFERVLKLLGCPAGDAAVKHAIGRGSTSTKRRGKRAIGGRQGLLGAMARLDRVELTEGLKELCRAAGAMEELVLENNCSTSSDSDEDDDNEREVEMPSISEQLGSVIVFIELARLVDATTSQPKPLLAMNHPVGSHNLPSSALLVGHYVTAHLLSSAPFSSILSAYDSLDGTMTGSSAIDLNTLSVRRGILIALRSDENEESEVEVEKRWARLQREIEASKRILWDAENSRRKESSRTTNPKRPMTEAATIRSSAQAPPCRRSRSFDSAHSRSGRDSDSDIEIISQPTTRTTRPPLVPPVRQAGHSLSSAPASHRLPSRPHVSYISSEPDDLALLPIPRRCPLPTKVPAIKKRRVTPPTIVQAPLSPSPAPSSLEVSSESRSTSPPTLPPKCKRLDPTRSKKRPAALPARKRKLDTFVRTRSAPSILFSTTPVNGSDDDDELAMSF